MDLLTPGRHTYATGEACLRGIGEMGYLILAIVVHVLGDAGDALATVGTFLVLFDEFYICLLYTSPSPRDRQKSRMPSSA